MTNDQFREVCESLQKLANGLNETRVNQEADRIYVKVIINYMAMKGDLDMVEMGHYLAKFIRLMREKPSCTDDERRLAERIEALHSTMETAAVLPFTKG